MNNSSNPSAVTADAVPPAWRRWLAYVAVALMPISINIERIRGELKRPDYYGPFDVLLPVLALFMLFDLFQRASWARLKFPAPATIIWAILGLVSYFWLLGGKEAIPDWRNAALNPLVVVMISSWVFSNITNDPGEFRKLALILCASFGICVLWALYQYMGPVGVPYRHGDPSTLNTGATNMRIGGWYDNRMLFGAQAAMFVPAAAAFAAFDKDPLVKVLAAAMAIVALSVTMAVGGFIGAIAGIVAVAGACIAVRNYSGGFALFGGVLILVAFVLPHLPAKRSNGATLARGLALFVKPDENKDEMIPSPRLRRYQAALDFLSAHRDPMDEKTLPNWIVGAGAGRFTGKINEFYNDAYYPKPGAKTDDEAAFDIQQHERDGYGLLEKTGMELGAVGLLALVFLFATWLMSAARAFAAAGPGDFRTLALASLGACIGAAVVSVFAFPNQRGASGGTFAFFFGLAAWLNARVNGRESTPPSQPIAAPSSAQN